MKRSRLRLLPLLLPLVAACGDEPEATDAGADAPVAPGSAPATSRLSVVDFLDFVSEEAGVTIGFDLDDRVSDYQDDATCRKPDFTSPDGEEGIDNQLARLVPALQAAGATALPGLVQGAIRDGGLLVMFQLHQVDDWQNDDDVRVMARIGAGRPLLGTDGELLSGQTFGLHENTPDTTAAARIEDGVLTAGPFDVKVAIVVFELLYELTLHGAWLRATLTFDGGMADGVIGGGVDIAEITEIAAVADSRVMGEPFTTILVPLVRNNADLDPAADGVCTRISASLRFTAVSGFLFERAP